MPQEEHPDLPETYYMLIVEDPELEDGTQEWTMGVDKNWSADDVIIYCAGVLLIEGYDNSYSWKIIQINEATEDFQLLYSSDEVLEIPEEEDDENPTLN